MTKKPSEIIKENVDSLQRFEVYKNISIRDIEQISDITLICPLFTISRYPGGNANISPKDLVKLNNNELIALTDVLTRADMLMESIIKRLTGKSND